MVDGALCDQAHVVPHGAIALSLDELAGAVVQALKIFGTDFTLISRVFAGRSRRQIKNKYTKENKVYSSSPCMLTCVMPVPSVAPLNR